MKLRITYVATLFKNLSHASLSIPSRQYAKFPLLKSLYMTCNLSGNVALCLPLLQPYITIKTKYKLPLTPYTLEFHPYYISVFLQKGSSQHLNQAYSLTHSSTPTISIILLLFFSSSNSEYVHQ